MQDIQNPVDPEEFWEDLGRPKEPEEKKFLFGYNVLVGLDGTINTQLFEATEEFARKATTFDVYSSSRDLVQDIESQMLASRISKAVLDGMAATDPKKEAREKLISALSNRGIETPNT